jgi:predicted ribosomally synthesized peptide with SipW-like signal peptide
MKQINKNLTLSIFVAIAMGLVFVSPAFAYFTDTETAEGSTMQADTLSFDVTASSDFALIKNPTVTPSRSFNLTKNGDLDFDYIITVENVSGDLCPNLNLKDDVNNTYQLLNSFSSPTITFTANPNVDITAQMISSDESWQSKSCTFDLVIKGWQPELDSSHGFSAEKRFSEKIESGRWIINPGDIVINELMWMGSYMKSKDEWIELKNTTSYDVDLSGFQITKLTGQGAGKYETLMLTIPAGTVISANGYFLISRFSESDSRVSVTPSLVDANVDLRDANLQIKIYKGDWNDPSNLIDTADDGNGLPAAGYEGFLFHFSMERNDSPGNGADESSWHTCLDLLGTRIYWDYPDILDFGTPGDRNLSDESDADLSYYINREQELLAEKEYAPDLEKGQDDGLLVLGSSASGEVPLSEEQNSVEIVDVPEAAEIKVEEPIVLENQGGDKEENNIELEIVSENQIIDDVVQDSENTTTDTEQNNIESNETPETI